jgi:hypothetical protein
MVLTEFAEPADQDPECHQVWEMNFLPLPDNDGQGGDSMFCSMFYGLRCQAGPTNGKQYHHQDESGAPQSWHLQAGCFSNLEVPLCPLSLTI